MTITFVIKSIFIFFAEIMRSKFETRSYCVGGRHYSSTSNLDAYVTETATRIISWYMYRMF